MKNYLLIITAFIIGINFNVYAEVKIKWLGGPTTIIEFDGVQIITDPILGEGDKAFYMGEPNEYFDLNKGPRMKYHKRITPLPKFNMSKINYLLLSHGHEDHFDQLAIKKFKNIKSIIPKHDSKKVKSQAVILDWGDSTIIKTKNGTISIYALNAYHSLNPKIDNILGKGNSYLLQFKSSEFSKKIYWTGDSFYSEKIKDALKNFESIDLLIPHLGNVGLKGPLGQISMNVKDTISMAKNLDIRRILPIHHSTLELYQEPIDQIVPLARKAGIRLDLISEGSILLLE